MFGLKNLKIRNENKNNSHNFIIIVLGCSLNIQVGTNFTQNRFSSINKTIQIIFSKVLTIYTIYGFIHSNSYVDYIHTIFLL
jgi:hypothetical protein